CFFFQAEDGIRDRNVTGVQTCALPIWRLVRMLVAAVLPAERHEPQTERVERGQERGADAEGPEQVEAGVQGARIEGDRQDLALREESAEGYDAGEGERAEEHDLRGDGQGFREPPHLPHVIRVDRMDHAAGTQEQEGLEESVVEKMVQRRAVPGGVYGLAAGDVRRHDV